MNRLKITSNSCGAVRELHSVNCAPYKLETGPNQDTIDSLFGYIKPPRSRLHDPCYPYGWNRFVDVPNIFPNFDADANDPTNYDFHFTDEYIGAILKAGTQIVYRLGVSIEWASRKETSYPPKDAQKWAEICEHIIRHYNEGWANGFRYDIEYWEIWNEPDMNADDCADKKTWGGTKAQFFDFFETAARHLKETFPQLKIGGPAICGNEAWGDEFLAEMHKREISLDFFSWHIYCVEPTEITEKAKRIRSIMRKNGYERAESILNEWNYVKDWGRPLEYIRAIKGMKGAAFCAAVMCAAQNCDVDMLMYYDARIEKVWNGMFSSDTLLPLKGYYPFKMFNLLYRYGTACECSVTEENVYAVAAKNEKGENAVMLCYYTDRAEGAESKTISSDFFGGANRYEVFLLDEKTNGEKVGVVAKDAEIKLEKNTVLLLKSL